MVAERRGNFTLSNNTAATTPPILTRSPNPFPPSGGLKASHVIAWADAKRRPR